MRAKDGAGPWRPGRTEGRGGWQGEAPRATLGQFECAARHNAIWGRGGVMRAKDGAGPCRPGSPEVRGGWQGEANAPHSVESNVPRGTWRLGSNSGSIDEARRAGEASWWPCSEPAVI